MGLLYLFQPLVTSSLSDPKFPSVLFQTPSLHVLPLTSETKFHKDTKQQVEVNIYLIQFFKILDIRRKDTGSQTIGLDQSLALFHSSFS